MAKGGIDSLFEHVQAMYEDGPQGQNFGYAYTVAKIEDLVHSA
jgi:hypothetical protein